MYHTFAYVALRRPDKWLTNRGNQRFDLSEGRDYNAANTKGKIVRMAHRTPPGPTGRPPLADLRALQIGPHAFLQRAAAQYGDVLRYPLGPLAAYLVSHPDGVRHVLQDNGRNYSKDTFQYNLLGTITGRGLLTSDGDFWLRQRRLAQPAFHRQRIVGFGAPMADVVEAMLARWQPYAATGRPLDIAAEMMHAALQIVGRTLFSVEIGDQADVLARATLTVLDHIVFRARTFGVIPAWLPTPGNLRARRALRTLDRAVWETIRSRRQAGRAADGAGQASDLLALLMAARDEETGQGMNDRQLRDEIMTMLIAGHETVASALAWTWYLLATAPEAEAALHAELDRVLAGRLPTVEDLARLPYVGMVFAEALRLYPPAWIITRKALADDEIGGYTIPAGALVVASPYVTHRDARFWPEPDRFRPERFGAEEQRNRPRFAYYPFGGGPRLCIGNHFAEVEAGLIIARVAQRYVLRLTPGQQVAVEPSVTLRPRHGLWMTLRPR